MTETAASIGTTYVLTVRVPQLVGIGPNAARREHHMARARRVKRERGDVALVLTWRVEQEKTTRAGQGTRIRIEGRA